jgi:uncharacterized protein (DUF1501 family)
MKSINRRQFLEATAALGASALPWSQAAFANSASTASTLTDKLTVMVYLKGGNDGYNTVVPFTNALYAKLRPTLALKRDDLILINETQGFHHALAPLMPLWKDNQLAVLQGIGQSDVTNQHYRDAETQFTASGADQFLDEGWMTRAMKANRTKTIADQSINALAFGDLDIREADPMGPFRGGDGDVGVVNIAFPSEWLERRNVAATSYLANKRATDAATRFAHSVASPLKTTFPDDSFGKALQATVELAAARKAPPVVHICLNAEDGDQHHAFDTHWDQQKYHAPALARLANGLAAFRAGMQEIGRWNDTLLFTYDEFGRSPKENEKRGTHHGWASVHFVTGGRVTGGLLGAPLPVVNVFQIDGPPPVIDYRALYSTVIESHWGGSAQSVFQSRFKPLDLLKV